MSDPPTTSASPEQTFGRYRVLRELGKGAMGAVYLAHDAMLGRDVAVKTMKTPPGAAADDAVSARFMNEARAIAALDHANVVRVFDMGVEDGTPYLVMEVVSGRSLKERLEQDGPLSPSEVCTLGIQLAGALTEAHAAGIVHRDVKPANILEAKPGQWKLGDFGVARVPDSSLTLTGQFLGTPAYAAPETLTEGKFAPSCDVYGLASTLYEAVSGQAPYPRSPQLRMAALASGESPRPLAELAPDVPPDLGEVIARALEPAPDSRSSAVVLAEELAVVSVHGIPPPTPASSESPAPGPAAREPAAPPAGAAPARPPRRRGKVLVLGAAIVVAGAGAAIALSAAGDSGAAPPGPETSRQRAGVAAARAPEDAARAAPEPTGAAPSPPDAAPTPPDAAPTPPDAATAIPELERARRLADARQGGRALELLEKLRSRHPDRAEIPYLMGGIYFGRMWWSQGFDRYEDALELDPGYREDPTLIRDAIEALKGSRRTRALRFLERRIGAPAIPHLEEASRRRDSLKIRRGAEQLLERLR